MKPPPVYKPHSSQPPNASAPPVYRPQQNGKPGVQLKPSGAKLETRSAPPVYRPQNPAKIAQPKLLPNSLRVGTRPAPPVFAATTSHREIQKQTKPSGNQWRVPPAPGSKALVQHLSPARPGVVQPAGLWDSIKSCFSGLCGSRNEDVPLLSVNDSDSHVRVAVTPVRRVVRPTVEQDDFMVLKPSDSVDFGLITSCSAVYARSDEGKAVVYHWPGTAWTTSSIQKMTEALNEIGWTKKSSAFSIHVYKQAYNGTIESYKAEMDIFAANLKNMFTPNVQYTIYPDKSYLTMDGTGKVNV